MSEDGRFTDHTVLVTGSNYGIGRGIAERFAAEGAAVVVTGRNVERTERVADSITEDGGTAMATTADLTDPDAIEQLVQTTLDQFGPIDVLVNNAAAQTQQHIDDTTIEEWDLTFDVNVRSYWLTALAAIEEMPVGGSIINLCSNHANETGPGVFPYNVSKTAVHGVTRALALEYGPHIRANTLISGWVPTGPDGYEPFEPEREHQLANLHPVGRMGRPSDLAGAAAFLASEDATFITGIELIVDGGRDAVMYDQWLPTYADERRDR